MFGRALLILVLAFGLLSVITFGAVVYYALAPVAKRSAEDLAAFMVLSAQTWAMLPPGMRQHYVDKLYAEHDLWLTQAQEPIPQDDYFLPYVHPVEQSLEERLGFPVPVRAQVIEGRRWFWVDLAVGQGRENVRVGFPRDRIRTRPLVGLLIIGGGVLLLVMLTSALLARQITRPLTRLSEAAARVGRGQLPQTLPQTGPRELAAFVAQFNRMAVQVKELFANRTTLLAGISHDLRTPISRIRLALEMLPQGVEPRLVERMKGDLQRMDELIGQSLDLARNLESGRRETLDLADLIDGLVVDLRCTGAELEWSPPGACPCLVNPSALQRVLANLLENALRYGGGKAAVVELDCGAGEASIRVLDRGPGIPDAEKEAVFRPFYRLEASRSRETGGSGLGLAIALQLAEANGFAVELRDRQGGGTVASVRLPDCGGDQRVGS